MSAHTHRPNDQRRWGRKAKIVATLGPSSRTPQAIRQLLQGGVDVVRLNFSHGTHEEHANLIKIVRDAARSLERHVAVLQDLQGPKMRTGPLTDGKPTELRPGDELVIAPEPQGKHAQEIAITYSGLHNVVGPGSRILLDDGRMEVMVVSVQGRSVFCRVVRGGLLGSNKGVNLPGASIPMPAFTEKDAKDLELGLEMRVDWIALSFVRQAADIGPLREAFRRHRVRIPVLAKLERPEALKNLHQILRTFDGALVARGDLAVELSPEEVPIWQKSIIRESNRMGKPVIVATQMLESMIENPRPTRAEASDVANAVLDGADALMLSGETAVGSHPAEVVSMMARIIERTESSYDLGMTGTPGRKTSTMSIAQAACAVADNLHSQAIAVLTTKGMTARLVSTARPLSPIIAFTRDEKLARQVSLYWGVEPKVLEFDGNTELALSQVGERLLMEEMVTPRGLIVVVGSTPLAARGQTNFIKIQRISADLASLSAPRDGRKKSLHLGSGKTR